MDHSLWNAECFQLELYAADRSLFQRILTECVSLSVIRCDNNPLHVQRVCRNWSEQDRQATKLHSKNVLKKFLGVTSYLQCIRKVAVHLYKMLQVMSTSVYTCMNPFNFIRKFVLQICVRKFAVHLYKVLEVMSTSIDTGLNQVYLP
jgi:hypothetical protein